MSDPAFYWMDLDHTHVADLTHNMTVTLSPLAGTVPGYEGILYGIVSEADGGIIAYAIGEEHANLIVDALKGATR